MPSRQEIRDFIQTENASHKVVIWSKSYCPFCVAAKHVFETKLQVTDLVVHEIDQHQHGRLIQIELLSLTGQRTVPNVFVSNQRLGGNDQVQEAYLDGSLNKMLHHESSRHDEDTDSTRMSSFRPSKETPIAA